MTSLSVKHQRVVHAYVFVSRASAWPQELLRYCANLVGSCLGRCAYVAVRLRLDTLVKVLGSVITALSISIARSVKHLHLVLALNLCAECAHGPLCGAVNIVLLQSLKLPYADSIMIRVTAHVLTANPLPTEWLLRGIHAALMGVDLRCTFVTLAHRELRQLVRSVIPVGCITI